MHQSYWVVTYIVAMGVYTRAHALLIGSTVAIEWGLCFPACIIVFLCEQIAPVVHRCIFIVNELIFLNSYAQNWKFPPDRCFKKPRSSEHRLVHTSILEVEWKGLQPAGMLFMSSRKKEILMLIIRWAEDMGSGVSCFGLYLMISQVCTEVHECVGWARFQITVIQYALSVWVQFN